MHAVSTNQIADILHYNIMGNMCIATVCKPGCDVMIFWSQPYLSNQVIFPTWPKSRNKNLNILRTKRTFKMK